MLGQTVSHYQITDQLGQGGMGVVYKATDTKLDRTVALKFLPTHSLPTDDDKARFEREAKAAASLNHPNIAHVYEIDEADQGKSFIAMEFVEGETLAEKIKQGPLSLKDAFSIATQVAEGLAHAHQHGIVHRDIKPGNIIVTPEGRIKILDFGLAKLSGASLLTVEGSVLGTMAYMSPEQIHGEEVDHRTDVWALGVVLYEMVAGRRPFEGDYRQALAYSILNVDPESLTGLRVGVPIALDGLLGKCLAKGVGERYQHVDEVPVDLKRIDLEAATGASRISTQTMVQAAVVKEETASQAMPWKKVGPLLAIAVLATALMVWLVMRPEPSTPRTVTHVAIPIPEEVRLAGATTGDNSITISRDGQHLVYVGSESGTRYLYHRPMNQTEAVRLPGTDGVDAPFFSPDRQQVAFWASGTLKKIRLDGSSPLPVAYDIAPFRGGAWSEDDMIIFGVQFGGLLQVPASGGTPEPLTQLDSLQSDVSHRYPEILPGGKTVLFTIQRDMGESRWEYRTGLLDLATRKWRIILDEEGFNARYAPTGHLVYARDDRLMAIPFDLEQRKITGLPVPLIEGMNTHGGTAGSGAAAFHFTSDGSLVFIPGTGAINLSRLVWVNFEGQARPISEEQRDYGSPSLSPDGTQIAVDSAPFDASYDIWIYDVRRGTPTRLTPSGDHDVLPIWKPSGEYITFASDRDGQNNIYIKHTDDLDEAMLLWGSENQLIPYSWSPDGSKLAFYERNLNTDNRDLWILSSEDTTATPFLVTEYNERAPVFSPDGKWIAYVSDETGQYQVYVKPFPGPGRREPISREGGDSAMWDPDEHRLYYRNGEKMMAVDISFAPVFSVGEPEELFEGPYTRLYGQSLHGRFDVHPDGDRFLMLEPVEATHGEIRMVLNWFEELKQRVPVE